MSSPSPSEPRTASLYHAALALAGGAILVIYALQIVVVAAGAPPLAAVAVSLLGAIAVVAGFGRRRPGLAGVRGTRPRFFVAALLVGSALWYPALVVVELLLPSPNVAPLEQLVERSALGPTVIIVAMLPAIAEELVFRGVLARALARRFGPALAVVLSAAVFGLYHLQPVQMITTSLLGLALGFIAVRADSALPTMLAHATNNAVVIAMSRDADNPVARTMAAHPFGALAACLVLVAGGVALAAPAAPSRDPSSAASG